MPHKGMAGTSQRVAYLDQACQGEPELRLQVESLFAFIRVQLGIPLTKVNEWTIRLWSSGVGQAVPPANSCFCSASGRRNRLPPHPDHLALPNALT